MKDSKIVLCKIINLLNVNKTSKVNWDKVRSKYQYYLYLEEKEDVVRIETLKTIMKKYRKKNKKIKNKEIKEPFIAQAEWKINESGVINNKSITIGPFVDTDEASKALRSAKFKINALEAFQKTNGSFGSISYFIVDTRTGKNIEINM
jgi:hypothetical protein